MTSVCVIGTHHRVVAYLVASLDRAQGLTRQRRTAISSHAAPARRSSLSSCRRRPLACRALPRPGAPSCPARRPSPRHRRRSCLPGSSASGFRRCALSWSEAVPRVIDSGIARSCQRPVARRCRPTPLLRVEASTSIQSTCSRSWPSSTTMRSGASGAALVVRRMRPGGASSEVGVVGSHRDAGSLEQLRSEPSDGISAGAPWSETQRLEVLIHVPSKGLGEAQVEHPTALPRLAGAQLAGHQALALSGSPSNHGPARLTRNVEYHHLLGIERHQSLACCLDAIAQRERRTHVSPHRSCSMSSQRLELGIGTSEGRARSNSAGRAARSAPRSRRPRIRPVRSPEGGRSVKSTSGKMQATPYGGASTPRSFIASTSSRTYLCACLAAASSSASRSGTSDHSRASWSLPSPPGPPARVGRGDDEVSLALSSALCPHPERVPRSPPVGQVPDQRVVDGNFGRARCRPRPAARMNQSSHPSLPVRHDARPA